LIEKLLFSVIIHFSVIPKLRNDRKGAFRSGTNLVLISKILAQNKLIYPSKQEFIMFSQTIHFINRPSILTVTTICLLILISFQIASAQTEVAGEVSGVWNTDGSPYIAIDSIIVSAGDELTIEPGVEVRFEEHVPILVYGLLRAVGTEEDSVYFVSIDPENDVRWAGIQFSEADDGCIIAFAYISGAGWAGGAPQEARGILIHRSSLVVRNCLITNCMGYNSVIWAWWAPEAVIENNTIEGNVRTAIWCSGEGLTTISGNLIRENAGYGIDAYGSVTAHIESNQVLDNGRAGILLRNTISIVENNTISGNARGGISSTAGRAVIKGNVISGNETTGSGGGLVVGSGHAIVAGNVFVGNIAQRSGGGVSLGGEDQIHFYNNIVFGNRSEDSPGGIVVGRDCRHSIQNCVLWDNRGDDINRNYANIGFSDVQQRFAGNGMLNEDPGFIDPEAGDFRLTDDSPCIDTGNPFPMYNNEDGSRTDIGAYGGNGLLFGFNTSIEFPTIGRFSYAHSNFALCNLNEDMVTLSELELNNRDNFILEGEAPLELPPYEWFDFPITFHPLEAGEHEAAITFIFEDYEPFNEAVITLTGEVLEGIFGEVSGVWTREMSPIHIVGNAFVPRWDTLRIEPGVEVRFDPDTKLESHFAYGELTAIGTPDDSIRFTSAQEEPEPGDWNKLEFRGRMTYCIVEYAHWGLRLRDGQIYHSTIRNNTRTGVSIHRHWNSGLMSHCWVENCGLGVSLDPVATIEYSTIVNCRDAIYPTDGGFAYHNVFAFNVEVDVAHSYFFGFGDDIQEYFAHLTCEGNIFYQNEMVSTFSRPHPAFRYNCLFESEIEGEGQLIGELEWENLNGTSCDENFNIVEDPLFIEPDNLDFHLQEDSHCIDAGNPWWQRDPDGSWADLGPFPFHNDEGDPAIIVEPESIEAEGGIERAVNLSNDGEGRLWWRTFLDADWIECDTHNGVLLPDEDMDIFIELDDEGFEPGIYEATLTIDSNDPENPAYEIDISMRIGGQNMRAIDISLTEGWNMISINVDPLNCYVEDDDRGPDILRMFMPFTDDLILLKDDRGRFYAPEFDNFVNIPFWNLTEGYMIKVRQDVDMRWSGEIIPADSEIPVEEGWNYVAYFPEFELPVEAPEFYAFESILDNLLIAKDEDGNFCVPAQEFSNMPPLRTGEGYQVKVDEDVVLNYPEEEEIVNRRSSIVNCRLVSTSENMSMLVTSVKGVRITEGDQIIAFSSDDRMIGAGMIDTDGRCGLAVWGDDPSTEVIDGLQKGEVFELRLWDANREIEVGQFAGTVLHGNGLVYDPDGFIVLDVVAETAIPENFYLSQNYPNPFNAVTNIFYSLPEVSHVSIRLYDVSGRLIDALIDDEIQAGYHAVTWEAATVATSVYILRMEASDFKAVRKLVVVK